MLSRESEGLQAVMLAHAHPESHREWYPLDNAATLFPSVASSRITTLFRISATLDRPVRVSALEAALANLMPRFPYYLVHLRAGAFWYYLARKEGTPPFVADSRWPCMSTSHRLRGVYLFRVRAFGRRVAVEFSHIITDGTGALTFLRALLAEYFALLGVAAEGSGDLFRKGDPPAPEESEDAYRRYFSRGIPSPEPRRRAFRLPYRLLPIGVYRIVTGIVSVKEITRLAKERGVTVTVLLAAILAHALHDLYLELPESKRRRAMKDIRIEIPVNLRRIYETRTMRNFSLFVAPGIDMRLGAYSLDDIVKLFHHFMEVSVDGRFINQQIARNIRGQLNPFLRVVPLFVKNLVFPSLYFWKGEGLVSSVLTNLGVVTMPEPLCRRIERFEFIPAPSKWNKTGCAVVSYGESAYISFGRMINETEVERRFFTTLVKLGIRVRIESN